MRQRRLQKHLEALFGWKREVRDHAFDVALLLGDDASHEHFRKAAFTAHGFRQNGSGQNEDLPVGEHAGADVAAVFDRGREVSGGSSGRKEGEYPGTPREFFGDEVGRKPFRQEKELRVFAAAFQCLSPLYGSFCSSRPIECGDFGRVGGQNVGKRREDLTHGAGEKKEGKIPKV